MEASIEGSVFIGSEEPSAGVVGASEPSESGVSSVATGRESALDEGVVFDVTGISLSTAWDL